MPIEIQYQEVSLANVLAYYADGFDIKDKAVYRHEAFVDTVKGVVVFKLYTKPSAAQEVTG